jgi:glycine cleavage system protein P-like pyridoxal-binding family
MMTYPSTHGVFEENMREICAVHPSTAARSISMAPTSTRMVGMVRHPVNSALMCAT